MGDIYCHFQESTGAFIILYCSLILTSNSWPVPGKGIMEINSQLLQQYFPVCVAVIGMLEYDSYSLGFNPW